MFAKLSPEEREKIMLQNDAEDIELMYAEDENYVCTGKCYRCGKIFNYEFDEQIWSINQQAGYGSDIDGSHVSITICDSCMMEFLKK